MNTPVPTHVRTATGVYLGASTDPQAGRVWQLVEQAEQKFGCRSCSTIGRRVHTEDPRLVTETMIKSTDPARPGPSPITHGTTE
ncbi:hypothetical protein ACXPWS_15370 [Mycobacterium sp. BMJ-28]